MEEVRNPSACVRCCPKQWPCTRVRKRSFAFGVDGDSDEEKEDEEKKVRCDCTDMILNDRVCIGTRITGLGGENDRKEARPQPSIPEEVHLGHYILNRERRCRSSSSSSSSSKEAAGGGGGGTCAWLEVKPVGHGLFDAASVLEALYQPWAMDGRVCIPLFASPDFLEEDELEEMAKKGEKTPHMLGCVKIGCADEEETEEGEEEDEESGKWEVRVKKEVYLDFHIFVRESKVQKRAYYVSHMTSSLRITLNDVTTKLMALLSWNYEEHVDATFECGDSRSVVMTMSTTHVRQICTRSGFAATYRLSGTECEEELVWGRCCNRYRGWVSEFKLKQRSSSSKGRYLASYIVTGGGQICHHDGVICDDDDDDDDDDNDKAEKIAKIAAVAATSSVFSTFIGKEAEMSQILFSRGAAQLQLFFREDGSIKLVDARNELFPGSVCRELYEGEREEEHRIRQSGVMWDTVNPKEKAEVKRVTGDSMVVSEVGTLCASKQRFERRFSNGKLVYEELIGEPCQEEEEEDDEGKEVEKEKEKKKPTRRRNGNARRRERKRASKQQEQRQRQTALAFSFWRRCCCTAAAAAVVEEEEEEEEEESSSSSSSSSPPPLDIITCNTAVTTAAPPSLSCSPLPSSSSSSSPEPSPPFFIHSAPQLKENECGLCFRDDDDDDDSDQGGGGEGRGSLVINAPCGHQCVCKGCAEFLQREALKQGKAHGSCLVCMADVVCWVDKVYHAARA